MSSPNAKQKRWMARVADYGCVVSGNSNIQIHHCVGRTAKHNKIAVGHWFILPLSFELHDVSSNNEYNVSKCKNAFIDEFGEENELFMKMFVELIKQESESPFPDYSDFPELNVIGAIMGWVR